MIRNLAVADLVRLSVEDQAIPALSKQLAGRRDLLTSDLAITEFTSAVCRLRREGRLTVEASTRAYRELVDQIRQGTFQVMDWRSFQRHIWSRQPQTVSAPSSVASAPDLIEARIVVERFGFPNFDLG